MFIIIKYLPCWSPWPWWSCLTSNYQGALWQPAQRCLDWMPIGQWFKGRGLLWVAGVSLCGSCLWLLPMSKLAGFFCNRSDSHASQVPSNHCMSSWQCLQQGRHLSQGDGERQKVTKVLRMSPPASSAQSFRPRWGIWRRSLCALQVWMVHGCQHWLLHGMWRSTEGRNDSWPNELTSIVGTSAELVSWRSGSLRGLCRDAMTIRFRQSRGSSWPSSAWLAPSDAWPLGTEGVGGVGGSRRSGGKVWYLEDFCWSWGGADHGDWWWWWWCWPLWLGHWFAPSFDTREASKGTGSFMLSLSNMSSRSLESSKMPRRPSLPSSSVYFHPRCSLHSSCALMQTLSSSVISLLLFRGRKRTSVFREVEYPGGSTCFNYQLGKRFEDLKHIW